MIAVIKQVIGIEHREIRINQLERVIAWLRDREHTLEKLVYTLRGPFSTWEEAAIDAITLNGGRWAKLRTGSRDIGEILYACERFNGTGYLTGAGRAETTPYLWACTSVNDGKGKYVADGKFDPNANANGQVGVAAILKELWLAGDIVLEGVAEQRLA